MTFKYSPVVRNIGIDWDAEVYDAYFEGDIDDPEEDDRDDPLDPVHY